MNFTYKTADITRKDFETRTDGSTVGIWYLTNRQGMRVEVLDLGGTVHRIIVIGGDLKKHNVVLGARDTTAYETGAFPAAVTRQQNPDSLPLMDARREDQHVVMEHRFDDGPRAGLAIELHFALTEDNEFVIGRTISAPNALKPLPLINPRPLYLNLAGQEPGNVLDHAVAINANEFVDLTTTRDTCASTFKAVDETNADYRTGKALVDAILLPECLGGDVAGFDYELLLAGNAPAINNSRRDADGIARDNGLRECATVYCNRSHVYLDLATSAPCVRLTTFQPLGGKPVQGKGKAPYGNHSGFSIEPGPRPKTLIGPGQRWSYITTYRFTPDYPEGYYTDNGCMDKIL